MGPEDWTALLESLKMGRVMVDGEVRVDWSQIAARPGDDDDDEGVWVWV